MIHGKEDTYDFFISHAFEYKDSFVRELAFELKERGFRVWYDEFTLNIGNSLTNSIDKGIKNSICGIVVLSPHFFNKKWTKEELSRLSLKKNETGQDIILPIWHNISRNEIYQYSPSLADLYAITSDKNMDIVCAKLIKAINNIKQKLCPCCSGA